MPPPEGPPANGFVRHLWLGSGLTAFAAGTVGIVLPVVPTVPFYLLAAFCFARSRPEWSDRLHGHPRWGPPLRQWRDRRAISRRAKVSALGAMAVGVVVTGFALGWHWAMIPLGVMAITGTWIWTRAE
ncbi:MAG: YbaN family protein [Novosphingobium sp.]|nr:YbaN family protein [Novosphingobium sp.]